MNLRIVFSILGLLLLYNACSTAVADKIVHSQDEPAKEKKFGTIPFALYTEQLEFAAGIGFGWSGFQHGQAGIYGAALYTTNHSNGIYLRGSQFQIRDRLFMDASYINALYKDQRIYIRNNPDFPTEAGGTNESSEDNYLAGPGRDGLFDLDFYYLLPLGDGRTNIVRDYTLADGVLTSPPSGGQRWDPRVSGRSYVHLVPFYRLQDYGHEIGVADFRTNGLKLELEYDNRDFPDNPTYGSYQEFRVLRDFGWGDSSDSWTVIDLEFNKYFPLRETPSIRQQVIALGFWTADTPTWEQVQQGAITVDRHRPPPYMGATLGGIYRLRAYPSDRFNDKAAIYYSAEYRVMPRSNPLGNLSFLRFFEIDWWQIVGFVEVGRVAPDWRIKTLHTDMQRDIGIGLRAMTLRAVVRLDAAFSDESWQIYAMAGHPF